MTEQDKYLKWLYGKYNIQESLCDVAIKDENGNPKWEKRMAKKVNSIPEAYAEYCRFMKKEG